MTESRDPEATSTRQVAMDSLRDFARQEAERLEDQTALAARKKMRKAAKVMIQWAVVITCLGIIGYQFPKLTDALDQTGKPLRKGAVDTDARTDRCVAILWQVSKRLQEGRPVGNDLLCPASGKPFVVETMGDDVVVRSPRPDLYGFRQIQVSIKRPVPELIN